MIRRMRLAVLTILALVAAVPLAMAQPDSRLISVLRDPLPCQSGDEFVVRLFLETERDDLASINGGFTYPANVFEYRGTEEAPGFTGTATGGSVEFLNLGTYTFTINREDSDSVLGTMFVADVTFRLKESNLNNRGFTSALPSDPIFVRDGGSTFTRPFDLSATSSVTCGQGGIDASGEVLVRSELLGAPTCSAGGTAAVRLHLETTSPFVQTVELTGLYDSSRLRITGTEFLEAYGPLDGVALPADPFNPGDELLISLERPGGALLGNGAFLDITYEVREPGLPSGGEHLLFAIEEGSVAFRFQGADPRTGGADTSATEAVTCLPSHPAAWLLY